MPYKRRYPRKSNKKTFKKRGRMNYNRLIKTIKRVDTRQEFKRAPMLRMVKSHSDNISATQLTSAFAVVQAPYQDLPLQVGTNLDQNQRLSSIIYPQVLKFNGILARHTGNTNIQRFRVMVVRYKGESDMIVDNSTMNGFESFNDEWSHICRPGELWSTKPYVKDQIKVLFDKTYTVNDTNKSGVVVNITVPIRRRITFETTGQGNNAIGAGQIYLMISSDKNYNLSNYKTFAFYKDLQ